MNPTATPHALDIDEGAASKVPARMRVVAFGPTGPAVLAVAADLLPVVSGRRPLAGDIHVGLKVELVRLTGRAVAVAGSVHPTLGLARPTGNGDVAAVPRGPWRGVGSWR